MMRYDQPLISICIPAYNSGKYICSTIKSVVNQTWKNKEVIIVDDGSTDNTLEILRTFESDIVKVFTQKNKGASAARNFAYSQSKGDFIQWLDADDILAPDKIEKQINFYINNPDPLILHSASFGIFYYRIKTAKFNKTFLWQDLNPADWLSHSFTTSHYMVPACWLVSKELTNLAGLWNENLTYNDDGEYFCRVISRSKLIKFHPESICYYRKGNLNSLSRSISYGGKALDSLNLSSNLCIDHLLALNDDIKYKRASINLLSRINGAFKQSRPNYFYENIKRISMLGGNGYTPPKKSRLFRFVSIFLGVYYTNALKIKFWHLQILIERTWDKFMSMIMHDSI